MSYNVNKAITIEKHLGKKINFKKDVILEQTLSGDVVIKKWNLPEPQPSEQQLQATYNNNQIQIEEIATMANKRPILNQYLLSGGGKITLTNNCVRWSERFIIPIVSKLDSTDGYYNIDMPVAGTVIQKNDGQPLTVTEDGIPLANWEAIYYKLNYGSNSQTNNSNYIVVSRDYVLTQIPQDWVLILYKDGTTQQIITANYNRSNETFKSRDIYLENNILYSNSATSRIGINTASPKGTFDIQGSLYLATKTVNSNYTVQPTDIILIGQNNSSTIDITIPDAVVSTGRILIIKNISTATPGKNVYARCINSQKIDNSASASIAQGTRIIITSNGASWLRID